MKLLVLGGTLFLGRHVVEAALGRGHRVTTFTRGRTNPDLFSDVEALRGDRDGDLGALCYRTWDAVVDTSAYLPRQATAAARTLSGSIDRYCFISTASVYATFPAEGASEETPTYQPPQDSETTVKPETYGALKVGCERAILSAFPDSALVVRPGVLAGPYDPTGRLSYWVTRVAEGGEVLAPGDPAHPLELLDARDLAVWLITMLERRASGVFNASGPADPLSLGLLLETCSDVAATSVHFTWAPDAFLLSHDIRPWSDLPLWLPRDDPGPTLNSRKARAAGLSCRPIAETVRDVFANRTNLTQMISGPPRPRAIDRERERELLRVLHTQSGTRAGGETAPAWRTA